MTSKDKIARRKLSLLELAADLANVSRACKVMGYSRQQFYGAGPTTIVGCTGNGLHRRPAAPATAKGGAISEEPSHKEAA